MNQDEMKKTISRIYDFSSNLGEFADEQLWGDMVDLLDVIEKDVKELKHEAFHRCLITEYYKDKTDGRNRY